MLNLNRNSFPLGLPGTTLFILNGGNDPRKKLVRIHSSITGELVGSFGPVDVASPRPEAYLGASSVFTQRPLAIRFEFLGVRGGRFAQWSCGDASRAGDGSAWKPTSFSNSLDFREMECDPFPDCSLSLVASRDFSQSSGFAYKVHDAFTREVRTSSTEPPTLSGRRIPWRSRPAVIWYRVNRKSFRAMSSIRRAVMVLRRFCMRAIVLSYCPLVPHFAMLHRRLFIANYSIGIVQRHHRTITRLRRRRQSPSCPQTLRLFGHKYRLSLRTWRHRVHIRVRNSIFLAFACLRYMKSCKTTNRRRRRPMPPRRR